MAWDDIPDWATHFASAILQTVKEKDPHTFLHCCRVGRNSRQLAKALGLNLFEQAVMEYSGLFHDVGKVGVPDSILLKPGRLEPAEVEVMKLHPLKSAAIIEPMSHVNFFKELLPGIYAHHERIDGTGYPFNLTGDMIPLSGRVIAIVDSYDAMTNVRPYRNPLSKDKVLKELRDFSGRQFDEHLVKVFLELLPFIEKQDPAKHDKDEMIVATILKSA